MTSTATDPSPFDVAGAEPSRARARVSFQAWLPSLSTIGPLAALVLAGVFFSIRSDRFLTSDNLSLVLQQVAVVGILAIGQTLIILTAGVDLSVGAVMALGAIVMTKLAVVAGLNPYMAIAIGIAVCTTFGLVNGLLVTTVRLPPFIVTLGTLNIAFALVHIYSDEQTIAHLPVALTFLGTTFDVRGTDVTFGSLVTLALFGLAWFTLRQTVPGRHIYAMGNNLEAARLAGVHTRGLLLGVYAGAGFLYGVAALTLVARTAVGDPQAGQSDNLDSITAVVVGGTSLFGGRGSVIGTLIGTLIVGTFRNGLQLMGVSAIYQLLFTGVLVILAVTVDQISRRRQA